MIIVDDIKKAVVAVTPQFRIKKVELFGSYADGKNTEDSDIDLLVEFDSPFTSLITVSGLKIALEEKLNTEVDIIILPISNDSMLEIGKVVPIYDYYDSDESIIIAKRILNKYIHAFEELAKK